MKAIRLIALLTIIFSQLLCASLTYTIGNAQGAVRAQGAAADVIRGINATVSVMQPVVTVVITPTPKPTPVQLFIPEGSNVTGKYGTLWHKDRPDRDVLIIGYKHGEYPNSEEQVAEWLAKGEACLAEPGTRVYLTNNDPQENERAVGIEVIGGGRCVTYRGWVDISVINFRYGVMPIQPEPPDAGG